VACGVWQEGEGSGVEGDDWDSWDDDGDAWRAGGAGSRASLGGAKGGADIMAEFLFNLDREFGDDSSLGVPLCPAPAPAPAPATSAPIYTEAPSGPITPGTLAWAWSLTHGRVKGWTLGERMAGMEKSDRGVLNALLQMGRGVGGEGEEF
jgi:hypothetical protein